MNFFAKKSKLLLARAAEFPYITPCARGLSAVGSAPPCQGGGRGFEPRSPLHASTKAGLDRPFSYRRSGQVVRQGPAKPSPPVRIRASPPRAHRAPAFAGALFCLTPMCMCLLLAKLAHVWLLFWSLWVDVTFGPEPTGKTRLILEGYSALPKQEPNIGEFCFPQRLQTTSPPICSRLPSRLTACSPFGRGHGSF